jgi:hypothetical protein
MNRMCGMEGRPFQRRLGMSNLGWMTAFSALALCAAPAFAEPASTATVKEDKPDKPVLEKDLRPVDVVTTPASDLNLKKDEIPPLLVAAQERPYVLRGLASCQQIPRGDPRGLGRKRP